jgi:membrane associated rhomboid family serine protease/tetratricopeptide (TPR) repeat protein
MRAQLGPPGPSGGGPPGSALIQRRFWPGATLVLLALNIVVFLLMTAAGGSQNSQVLLDFGASYAPYLRRGEYWRAVMPMFLHIGWLHLAVNSYALYILGPILERVYGYGRFAGIYVAAGIGSSLLSMSLSNNVAAGASGAIFGIAGAMLVTGYLHREAIPPHWGRAFGWGILPFIVANLAFGFSVRGIDNWGHLGGLISGTLLGLFIAPPCGPEPGMRWSALREPTGGGPPRQELAPAGTYERPAPHPALQEGAPGRPRSAGGGIVVLPVAVVALAMAATLDHYRTSRAVTRLLQEGVRLRAAQQSDQALQRFQEAARRAPRDERPHEQLAALYLEQKQLDKAIQEYQEVARLLPGDERPHEQLGAVYLEQKQFDKAIQEYQVAVRLTHGSPGAQLGLGLAYRLKGDLPQAQRIFEGVLGKNPRTAEGQRLLADLYAEQKLYAEAIQHYQQALRLAPDDAVVHNNLAWLYATSGDVKFRDAHAALEHAQRAVDLTHWKEASFIDTLAEAHYASGSFQEAVRIQVKALELDPNNLELQEHMARYRKAAGEARVSTPKSQI